MIMLKMFTNNAIYRLIKSLNSFKSDLFYNLLYFLLKKRDTECCAGAAKDVKANKGVTPGSTHRRNPGRDITLSPSRHRRQTKSVIRMLHFILLFNGIELLHYAFYYTEFNVQRCEIRL